MIKIRAIYINDIKFNSCPIFELNQVDCDFKFVMLENEEYTYDIECVIEDDNWVVFEVVMNSEIEENNIAKKYSKKKLKKLIENSIFKYKLDKLIKRKRQLVK